MRCSEFALYDAATAITNGLKAGDTIDLDIVLKNPSGQSIQSVRAWLEFDATVLQGSDVRIDAQFPLVAPGEQAFAGETGIVRLGASNVSGGVNGVEFVFARVTFTVLSAIDTFPRVKFHDFSLLGSEGHTQALVIEGGRAINVIKTTPKDLILYFGDGPPPSTVPSLPPPPIPSPTPSPLPTPNPVPNPSPSSDTRFSRLQVQGLGIMTDQDKAFLIWDPLTDPEISGYNLYYGTQPGRYIQRRTMSPDTTGVTVRGLPPGMRYYFAVSAFNAREQETEFSHEVAVVIGDPTSSSAPFSLAGDTAAGSSNTRPGGSVLGSRIDHVPGGTGLPIAALILIGLISLGSTFLYRRLRHSSLPL
jgi:hypothetical protein